VPQTSATAHAVCLSPPRGALCGHNYAVCAVHDVTAGCAWWGIAKEADRPDGCPLGQLRPAAGESSVVTGIDGAMVRAGVEGRRSTPSCRRAMWSKAVPQGMDALAWGIPAAALARRRVGAVAIAWAGGVLAGKATTQGGRVPRGPSCGERTRGKQGGASWRPWP